MATTDAPILAPMDDLAAHADALADGVCRALPAWVERSVDRVHRAWLGPPPPAIVDAAHQAGLGAAADVGQRVRSLLSADIDSQTTTPLALLRTAVRYPTAVLADAGVPPVERDAMDAAMFAEDVYGLSPATFADIDPSLADLGLAWGAAKAWVHRRRHARPAPAPVIAYVPDLMDRSKVLAAAPAAIVVRASSDLVDAVRTAAAGAVPGAGPIVVVDLARPGVIEVIPAIVAAGGRVVGFGSHVDGELLRAAREAGCAEVLARSAFFGRIAELLG